MLACGWASDHSGDVQQKWLLMEVSVPFGDISDPIWKWTLVGVFDYSALCNKGMANHQRTMVLSGSAVLPVVCLADNDPRWHGSQPRWILATIKSASNNLSEFRGVFPRQRSLRTGTR